MRRKTIALSFVAAFLLLGHLAVAADFAVVNTNATGPDSLAQAITDANALPGADRIVFNIPGAGVQKIDVSQNSLPSITDTLTIDGYTQPGSRPNDLDSGSNAAVLIQVDGKRAPVLLPYVPPEQGLVLAAAGSVVRGLMLTSFPNGYSSYGTTFYGAGIVASADNCVIQGNLVGTDGTSATGLGNQGRGVWIISGSGSSVGGDTPAARNVIGGNGIGVCVTTGSSENPSRNVVIAGNQIGSNPPGPNSSTAEHEALGNAAGISLAGGSSTNDIAVRIGGTAPALANLISGNTIGIQLGSAPGGFRASGVTVQGNAIGLQPRRGSAAVTNQTTGIEVFGSDNMIGGLASGAGNEIAHNKTGVYVNYSSSLRNSILSNRIYAADFIPIDLDGRTYSNGTETSNALGPTSNDLGDTDTGGNNLQNFPIIARAETVPGGPQSEPNVSIQGSLNSTPNAEFTLQFFRYNLEPRLLGTAVVHTDAGGNAPFTFPFYDAAPAETGSYYTATATDAEGNTSEFMPANGPVQLANISTRGNVATNDFVMIGGFIIRSNAPKKVIIRALGPSLNVPERKLADPLLELYDSSGTLLAKNDDWRSGQQQEVMATGLAPSSDVESALIATLPAGNYTAQVRGADGRTGTGIVEVYDLDPFTATSGRLVNISTRAILFTQTDVLIGGFIVRGDAAERVLMRAIGPDVGGGLGGLPDPTLELHDSSGNLVATNDDWRNQQEAEITATGLAPHDDHDSAILARLAPGAYTAVLRGKNSNGGVALVEFYDLTN